MLVRQLKETYYQSMLEYLETTAPKTDLSASCEIVMLVDEMCYRLRLQPERHRKLAILQAVSWPQCRPEEQELIIDGLILSVLLELLIFQICTSKSANKKNF